MAGTVALLATADGPMRTETCFPATGNGPWPAVIFCMDGGGQRETLSQMADRIAQAGYVVVLPDLFHRAGMSLLDMLPPGRPRDIKEVFASLRDPVFRKEWDARFYGPATKPENLREDVGAVFKHLAGLPQVKPGGVGTTGYCMGGNCSLRLAALFPERVAACASFHGGGLATSQPNSPHLGVPRIKARVYIGGAQEDPSFTSEMKELLTEALAAAHVDHLVESYPARHGFAVPDSPAFDPAAAERHHTALLDLLDRSLKA